MTNTEKALKLKAVDNLLERERAAILEGRFEKITALFSEKERLVRDFNLGSSLEPDQIAKLRIKLDRNRLLLESSALGIRAITSRIEEFKKIRSGLIVYDSTGKVLRFGSCQQSKLEKKT